MEIVKENYSPMIIKRLPKDDDLKLIEDGAVEELFIKYQAMIYKLCEKYKSINSLYSKDDLINECYIILERTTKTYNVNLDSKASYITYLYNALNKSIWALVNGKSKNNDNCSSLNSTVNYKDDTIELQELIQDTNIDISYQVPEYLFKADLKKKLDKALLTLPLKKRSVVESVNGYYCIMQNYEELADMLGVSKGYTYQMIKSAYKVLRSNEDLKEVWETEYMSRRGNLNINNKNSYFELINEQANECLRKLGLL